jgi:hypothetical protein
MNKILEKNPSFSPLWLTLACNELKVFGEFTTVTLKIEMLSPELDGLILNIIKRIDSDISNDLIRELFCLLSASQSGLPENEIALLLKQPTENSNINRLESAHILRTLKTFLRIINHQNIQLISFIHMRLKKLVENLFYENTQEKTLKHHQKLIQYFQFKSKYRRFAIHQCVFHYEFINKINSNAYLKDFVALLHTREAYIHLEVYQRSRIFDVNVFFNKICK